MSYNTTPLLADFVASATNLRENMTYLEFNSMLDLLRQANDKGKLSEFLDQTEYSYYTEGLDPMSSFETAFVDVCVDPGEVI